MQLLYSITLFAVFGAAFVFANLMLGWFLRPKIKHPVKLSVYECGEEAVGSGWVQFDLRFYIVALVFLVFDVEVALFYPWAVAWGSAKVIAVQYGLSVFDFRLIGLLDMLFFFGVLMVGFAYLWRFGYLNWVRSTALHAHKPGLDISKLSGSSKNP